MSDNLPPPFEFNGKREQRKGIQKQWREQTAGGSDVCVSHRPRVEGEFPCCSQCEFCGRDVQTIVQADHFYWCRSRAVHRSAPTPVAPARQVD